MNTGLTQDQKRIKIAEAEGLFGFETRKGVLTGWFEVEKPGIPVPDYFKSRNACIKVILKMNPIRRQDFINALVMIVAPSSQWHDMQMGELFNFLTATPEQLCEAIGAAFDLW